VGKHEAGYARVERDHYPTPDWVIAALAEHVDLKGKRVWEPACGDGRMAEALKRAGAQVYTSDIANYGYPLDELLDFLSERNPKLNDFDASITNPPYGHRGTLLRPWIEAGLRRRHGLLALLLPIDCDSAKTRRHLFAGCPEFAGKIVLNERIAWFRHPDPQKEAPKENHAWFLWQLARETLHPVIMYAANNPPTGIGRARENRSSQPMEGANPMAKPKPQLVAGEQTPHPDAQPDKAVAQHTGQNAHTDTVEQNPQPAESMSEAEVEQLDEEEKELREMRCDLPGVKGASSAGVVTISVGKIPIKNAFFRTHKTFRPIVPMVAIEVGMDRQFFAVTKAMVEPLRAIGIKVTNHVLHLTVTETGATRIVPVPQAKDDEVQNEYTRTKELGLLRGMEEWVRLYTDEANDCYEVFPATVARGDPQFPDLKEAKIFRLAFRDKGRLIDSVEHPLFKKWLGRDA
jgi:hypothetical protein